MKPARETQIACQGGSTLVNGSKIAVFPHIRPIAGVCRTAKVKPWATAKPPPARNDQEATGQTAQQTAHKPHIFPPADRSGIFMKNDKSASANPPRPEVEVRGICAPEEAIGRLAGCRDLYADTVVAFFREVGKIVDQIGEAIVAGDTTAMRKTAHSLKGFAGMCGAVSVAEASAAIEQCAEASTVEERTGLLTRLQGEVAVAQNTLRPFTSQE